MVDIKELRIGNYLRYTDTKEIGFVVSINYDDESMKDNFIGIDKRETCEGINFLTESRISNFEPILITPELIQKCGFTHLVNRDVYILNGFCFEFREGEPILLNRRLDNLKYLHQLQNLYFVLMEEELRVELWK